MASSSTATSETLIPGLPDDISTQILLSLPLLHQLRLRPTCRCWPRFSRLRPPSLSIALSASLPSLSSASSPPVLPLSLLSSSTCSPSAGAPPTLHLPCSPFFYNLTLFNLSQPLSISLPDRRVGSFACAITGKDGIVVAGGGSHHSVYPSHGSRISSVERYSISV